MLDALDHQLQMKAEQHRQERMREMQLNEINNKYQ